MKLLVAILFLIFSFPAYAAEVLLGEDTFTDTAGTLLILHTPTGTTPLTAWSELADNCTGGVIAEINSNSARPDSTTGAGATSCHSIYTVTPLPTNADVAVYHTALNVLSGDGDEVQGVFARLNDKNTTVDDTDDDMYILGIRYDEVVGGNDETMIIQKRINGTVSNPDSGACSVGLDIAGSDIIKFEVIGTALKAYVNGVEKLSCTDNDITVAGDGVGLFWGNLIGSATDDIALTPRADTFQVFQITADTAVGQVVN